MSDLVTHFRSNQPISDELALEAADRIEALETLLEAPTKEEVALYARIEAMKVALLEISEMYPRENRAVILARAALDKDASK